MPEMNIPDDEGDGNATADVKAEDEQGDETMAEQSGGFAPAAAKEKTGDNKYSEIQTDLLQYHYATYFDNEKTNMARIFLTKKELIKQ